MKKIFFLLALTIQLSANQLQTEWRAMQSVYTDLKKIPFNQALVLPVWHSYASSLSRIILGAPHERFLVHDLLFRTMLRGGFGRVGHFELNFLQYFLSEKNKTVLKNFQDTRVGGLDFNCRNKQYAANTVGQLYYFGKIIESFPHEKINTFVELGAGYGSLARIAKTALPNITYVIIDLPELLSIQYLYLKLSMNSVDIIVHTNADMPFKEGAIHLVPIQIVKDISLNTTIFASHFALSESPEFTQKLIMDKKFFNADMCYIVGQVNSWGSSNSLHLAHHSLVQNELNKQFSKVSWQPYHHFDGAVANYEAIAYR